MANRFSVEAIFKAVDRITAPVNIMQNKLGKFTRTIERNLKNTIRVTNRFSKSILNVGKRLFQFGAVATIAAIAATTVAITKAANAADDLAKRADRISFPIEELQQWQFVANQSGLTTKQFDTALENFVGVLGKAKLGGGALETTLKQFNRTLLNQIKSTTNSADAFDLLINGIRETEDETVKVALSMAAFGRVAGINLINVANQSSDAIDRLIKQQIENGIITRENARNAELYNDALGNLKSAFNGLLNDVILPLLPHLTEMILRFRQLIITNKEIIISKINETLSRIKVSIENIVTVLKRLNQEHDVLERLITLVEFLAKAFIFLVDNAKAITIIIGSFLALNLVLNAAVAGFALFNAVVALSLVGKFVLLAGVLVAVLLSLIPILSSLGKKLFTVFSDQLLSRLSKIVDFVKLIGKFLRIDKLFDIAGDSINDNQFSTRNGQLNTAIGPQVVSPQERISRSIEESNTTNTSEITIKDETGRAEVTSNQLPQRIQLQASGRF